MADSRHLEFQFWEIISAAIKRFAKNGNMVENQQHEEHMGQ